MEKQFLITDALKLHYKFALALLFKDLPSAFNIMKKKAPLQGEIFEYVYMGVPYPTDLNYFDICSQSSKALDCYMNTINVFHSQQYPEFESECKNIAEVFHLASNDVKYYYIVACTLIAMESDFNKDAAILFGQLSDDAKNYYNMQKDMFYNLLSPNAQRLCFYNMLGDIESKFECNVITDENILKDIVYCFDYFPPNMPQLFKFRFEKNRFPVFMKDNNVYIYDGNEFIESGVHVENNNMLFGIYENRKINEIIQIAKWPQKINTNQIDDITCDEIAPLFISDNDYYSWNSQIIVNSYPIISL